MGGNIPFYGHHSLLIDLSGDNLSKRLGALSIKDIRNAGIEPMALNNIISTLGSSKSPKLLHTLQEISEFFTISSFGSAPIKFDFNLLNNMSSKILRDTPVKTIKKEFVEIGIPNKDHKTFWEAIRANLNTRDEISELWNLCINGTTPIIDHEDLEYVRMALKILPSPPYNKESWGIWTKIVSEKTGRKGKHLFLPLRKALTGKSFGPDMGKLLPFLSKIPTI